MILPLPGTQHRALRALLQSEVMHPGVGWLLGNLLQRHRQHHTESDALPARGGRAASGSAGSCSHPGAGGGVPAIELPPGMLGFVDDAWFRFVENLGVIGPDKGKGGKYLMLPPDHQGPVPDGYFVIKTGTYSNLVFLRGSIAKGLEPAVENIKSNLKVYPLAQADNPPETEFIDFSGKSYNTVRGLLAALRGKPPRAGGAHPALPGISLQPRGAPSAGPAGGPPGARLAPGVRHAGDRDTRGEVPLAAHGVGTGRGRDPGMGSQLLSLPGHAAPLGTSARLVEDRPGRSLHPGLAGVGGQRPAGGEPHRPGAGTHGAGGLHRGDRGAGGATRTGAEPLAVLSGVAGAGGGHGGRPVRSLLCLPHPALRGRQDWARLRDTHRLCVVLGLRRRRRRPDPATGKGV